MPLAHTCDLFVIAGEKEEDIIGAIRLFPKRKVNSTAGANKKDGGFCIGAGLEIPIREKFTLSFELRDNIGVYDINNTPHTKGGEVKTKSFNFLTGVVYRIDRKFRRR